MNLAIDIGNTRIKAALFEKNNLIDSFTLNEESELLKLSSISKANNIIIATVKDNFSAFFNDIKKQKNVIEFSANTSVPIKNKYQTASTLGSDRLPPTIAAAQMHPQKNILVIDAGTCIKYNFANSVGEYCGGGISPGLLMRFNALHNFTARLPLIEMDYNFDKLVGQTTQESILSGVINGTVAEIDGIISEYQSKYTNLVIYLTGGDAAFFEKRLKNSIFADPFLVLRGLNIILEHNINKS